MTEKQLNVNSADKLFAQQALNDELLRALHIGNTDDSSVYTSALDALTSALAVNFTSQMCAMQRTWTFVPKNQARARDDVYRQYVNHVLNARRQYGDDLPAVEVSSSVYSEEAHAAILGPQIPERERIQHEDASVRAYLLSRLNVERAKAKCSALEYLVAQLPAQLQNGESELGKALTALFICLSSRVAMRLTTMLKFAMLLGGSILEETRQEMIKQSFGPEKDVMGFLAFDELRQVAYKPNEDAAFRASIAQHAKRGLT